MQAMTDELLSAYLDGELDAARRADVETAIAGNPDTARRLAALREADELTREAFAAPATETVPDALLDHIAGTQQTTRPAWRHLPAWLMPSAPVPTALAGLAAGIVLMLILPFVPLSGGTPADNPEAPMQPRPLLARALNTTPSQQLFSHAGLTVAPLNTFRTPAGQICREYQARSSAQGVMTGIACRHGDSGWHNEIMLSLNKHKRGFTPAAADGGLRNRRKAWRNADMLSRDAERQLLQRWSTQGG